MLREAAKLRGFPECAIDTFLHSLSDSTLQQYNYTYKIWWQHCMETSAPVFTANVAEVITFLQYIVTSKNCKYGTLNSHRSALSLLLGDSIGSDKRISRFMKGASKLRPPRPKYDNTWDPGIVLKYLEQKGSNSNLCLRELSQKLVTLLTIITGHRLQTIALIKLSNILENSKGIQILISDPIKTSKINKSQPCLYIPYYGENKNICVATTLIHYRKETESLRQSEDYLFLTYKKPYKKASKQSLSRWVKDTLKASGINTKVFQAHSTRHASTSFVHSRGLSVDSIMKTAGWTNESTFTRFYRRPISNQNKFAETILQFGLE